MTDNNIVSAIAGYLSPDLVGKMAAAAGLEHDVARQTLNASLPAILGGLANMATQPGGAKQIANAVAEQPSSMLSNVANSLGNAGPFASKGIELLSSLLGTGTVGALSSAISRFAGSGEGSARTMIGLLTPIIMGVLGREQRASNLDAAGLGRMLASQKDNIASAMPAGLAKLLPRMETTAAPRAGDQRPYEPPPMAARAAVDTRSTRSVNWPMWVLPLLAIAALAWYLLPHDIGTREATNTPPRSPTVTTTQTPEPRTPTAATFLSKGNDDWVSVGMIERQDIYNRDGEKLGSVTDLLIGPDGRIGAAVISVGNFLGIGEKHVAVPYASVGTERRDTGVRLIVDTKKESLQAAPAFEQSENRSRANVPRLPIQDGTTPKQ